LYHCRQQGFFEKVLLFPGWLHGTIMPMVKKQTQYVITVWPESPCSKYFDENGKPVNKSFAMRFYTWQEAKEFADEHGIEIDGARHSIVVA
jgi:hypothetical protein